MFYPLQNAFLVGILPNVKHFRALSDSLQVGNVSLKCFTPLLTLPPSIPLPVKKKGGLDFAQTNYYFIFPIYRSVASTYRRDQDTCCKILQSISVLIPRLAVKEGRTSMDLLSARETALYLLNAFW